MIGVGLGLGRRRGMMGPVALRQFVTAAPKGAWFWPAMPGDLWQTEAQTTLATDVGQAVGRLDGRGPNGASSAATPIDYFAGSIGMFALTNTIPTAAQRAAIFAELAL